MRWGRWARWPVGPLSVLPVALFLVLGQRNYKLLISAQSPYLAQTTRAGPWILDMGCLAFCIDKLAKNKKKLDQLIETKKGININHKVS